MRGSFAKAGLLAVALAFGAAQAHAEVPEGPLEEVEGDATGYHTVAEALEALHGKVGVGFSEQDGWTIASDEGDEAIWSFPPPGHPAYPSAVKRQLATDDEGTYIDMRVHCEASKEACDDLVRSFLKLNEGLKDTLTTAVPD